MRKTGHGRSPGVWGAGRPGGRGLVPVVVALVLLAGCAAASVQQETERHAGRLRELGRGAEELRRDLDGLGREVAELRGQLAAVRREVQDARREAATAQQEALETVGRRLGETDRRIQGLGETLGSLEVSLGGLADQMARLEGVAGVAPPGVRLGPGGRLAPRSGSSGLSAEELFDRAMESFRGGEVGQSVLDFEEFVTTYPGHPLAGSAQFWIGEAYFRAREYEQAATEYQRAVDVAPTGEKTPDALLKLGLAHRALKRDDRAREVWARLIRDFPESEAAQKARATLR